MGASDSKKERDEDERDEDERDEHDADEAEAAERAKKPAEKAASEAKKPAEKAASAESDDEDEDDEDEDDEEAAKPASKPAAKGASGSQKPSAAKPSATPPVRAKGRGKTPAPPPRAQGGSLGKNMILFILIIGALAAGFAYLGKEEPAGAPPSPKWTVGQTVDVEITLVPNDVKELACAAPDAIGGKHCAFEAQSKPWSKGGDPADDKTLLRPYTTTDRVQFIAAGLWTQEAISKGKLPTTRFNVKCKYTIEGKLKSPNIRWSSAQPEQWFPQGGDWYAGAVSACVLVQ